MSKIMWRCDECGQIYDDEGDAFECCAEVTAGYECEECGKFYDGTDGLDGAADAVKNCTHDEDEEGKDTE